MPPTRASAARRTPKGLGRSALGVALVTGASRGVGRACALALAAAGHDIAVGYVSSEDAAREVVAEVEQLGRRAVAVRGDVRLEADCERIAQEAAEALGAVTVLVSNATGYPAGTSREDLAKGFRPELGPTLGIPAETYRETFDARVGAFLALARATVAGMPPGGAIIAITSTGTRGYQRGYGPTAVGMAGVEQLVRYLAAELGQRGIRVNAVCGGPIRTEALSFLAKDVEKLTAAFAARTPLGRVGEPEDLARVVAFLASPEGGWVTGQTLVVDGGHLTAG